MIAVEIFSGTIAVADGGLSSLRKFERVDDDDTSDVTDPSVDVDDAMLSFF